MVLTGGLWAAFQRHLGRILGYAVMVEIGLSLLAIGTQGSIPVFFASLLPRVLGLGVWALALSTVRLYSTDLHFSSIQGLARGLPVASAALVIANFSIAGFPILAGFPMRIALMENLARHDLVGAFLTVIGCIGLFAGGLRTFAVLIMGPDQDRQSDRREVIPQNNVEKQTTVIVGEWQITESRAQLFFLLFGILLLILVGLFPQWFFPTLANLQQAFKHLMP
jgi:formate hydrogenlyase subunit 3/multisubunit Na+/H+ antiporter MnhD subunit